MFKTLKHLLAIGLMLPMGFVIGVTAIQIHDFTPVIVLAGFGLGVWLLSSDAMEKDQ